MVSLLHTVVVGGIGNRVGQRRLRGRQMDSAVALSETVCDVVAVLTVTATHLTTGSAINEVAVVASNNILIVVHRKTATFTPPTLTAY